MTGSADEPSPIGIAMAWVARITAISLEMVLPALAGHWIDWMLGTWFFVLVGTLLGMSLGLWHLLLISAQKQKPAVKSPPANKQT